MTKNKIKHTIKFSILSLVIAIAMLLSFNYSFAFSLAGTLANRSYAAEETNDEAKYSYKAESVKEYLFETNQFNSNNTDSSSSVNSGKAQLSSRQIMTDYVADNKLYYPIVKYNGITTNSEDRKEIPAIAEKDKLDNYAGVISTNEYRVAGKTYTSEFETTEKGTEKIKKVYVLLSKASSTETEEQYNERFVPFKAKITALNAALADYTDARYVAQSVYALNYESTDFTSISKESTDFTEDIQPETQGKVAELDLTDYLIYFKKTFSYRENSLYLQTSSSYQFTNNSYYVLTAWVYTSGDAEASIELLGTKFSAKSEQINTHGTWQRVYIFIATRAQDSTNANIRLYYGDSYGVTGSKTLADYHQNVKYEGTDELNYMAHRLTGTVMFDDITIYAINYTDFINQTINGHGFGPAEEENTPANITPHYLADGIAFGDVVNNSMAILDGEGHVTGYTEAKYTAISDMTKVDTYVDRYAKNPFTLATFDATFDSLEGQTKADLVYNDTNLDYYTYERNNTHPFNYYVPRYSSGTTYTTTADINDYKTKYASDDFAISVVKENTEFEAYEKTYYDYLGNVEKTLDGKDRTDSVHNDTFASSNKILKIENNTSFDLGLVSPAILVPANGYYRVSVWTYSSDEEATATAKLFASIKTKDALVHGQLVISSGSTATDFEYNSDGNNGWKEITLFIQGNPTTSQNAHLVLMASKNSTVYFDNIKVEACTSSSYDNASSSNKIDLASYGKIKANVSNGNFDAVTVADEDALATYPYVAENWTVVKDSTVTGHTTNGVVSGVVSTKASEFNTKVIPAYNKDGNYDYYDADETLVDYLLDYAGKPLKTTTVKKLFGNLAIVPTTADDQIAKNIYAIHLPEDSDFMFRSTSISFSSSTVYKLTFDVWFGDDFTGTFGAKLMSSSSTDAKTIASITVDSSTLLSKNQWQQFTIYARTGATSQSLPLLFTTVESQGNFFIKDVNYTTLSAITDGNVTTSVDEQFDTLFDAAMQRPGKLDDVEAGVSYITRFVDFKNSSFSNHSAKADSETGLYEAYGYTLDEPAKDATYEKGTLGVVELGDGFTFDGNVVGNVINTNTKASTALALVNTSNDPKSQYTFANNAYNNTLASGKYFKVTVDVLASDMGENGLSIIANGFDTQFENISAKDSWTTYTFYLRTGTSSIANFSLTYVLGKTKDSYTGWAMLSNMQLTELTEAKYTAETEAIPADDPTFLVKSLAKEEDSGDDDTKSNANNFSWQTFFLVFSSVLLVASLVVALVAVIVKRNRKKKPVKVENVDKTKPQGGIE